MELSEKNMEDIIAQHPEKFIEPDLQLIDRQGFQSGRRFDLLFQDRFGRLLLVEIKKGLVTREAVGQILEYYGLLKQTVQEPIELMLIGNTIPFERRSALEHAGIIVKEIPMSVFFREMGNPEVLEDAQPKKDPITDARRKEPIGKKIALIGATPGKYIRLHYEYFKSKGKHWDGLTHRNIQDVEEELRTQIAADGYFLLYYYHSLKDGGPGRIRWKTEVEDLIVFGEREWFNDIVHGDDPSDQWTRYQIYSQMYYRSIEPEDIAIDDFFDVIHGRFLSSRDGSRLRNSFIIVKEP